MAINPDVVAAFFAGVGSIGGAVVGMKRVRKYEREHCAERIADIKEMYDRGLHEGLHLKERERDA